MSHFPSPLPPKVFLSYSHHDREFAARLATDLARKGILVWWDEWEIRVGDSLFKKIEDGITSSSYLAIVLSPASVNSAWVQEEIRAAMTRQLKEQRTNVLPILIAECQIPLFLQEKQYADFRADYKEGLAQLLGAIHPPDMLTHRRTETDRFLSDYAIEWVEFGGLYGLRIEIASHSAILPFAVSCRIRVISTPELSARLKKYEEADFRWAPTSMLLVQIEDIIAGTPPTILVEGDLVARTEFHGRDPRRGTGVDIEVHARRLGEDTGSDILYEW